MSFYFGLTRRHSGCHSGYSPCIIRIMSITESVILGLIQGVTEFLPISSTGHLILGRSLFGFGAENALAFDAILHLATAAAVIVYFRRDIWLLIQTLFRKLGRLPIDTKDGALLYALAVGTVPAVVLGLALEDLMTATFRSPLLVAGVLAGGSIFFMYAEYQYSRQKRVARGLT